MKKQEIVTEVKPSKESPAPIQAVRNDRVQDAWYRYGKYFAYGLALLLLLLGGYLVYQNYVVSPKQQKANDAMWKAEDYYRMDSARLALNGDGVNQGFLKIITRFDGTKAANLAKFYAGSCYLKLGDFNNAIKYLKDFSTDDKMVEVRATGLLGDAYAETGKKSDAATLYKKAGTLYEEDNFNSPEYLFRAGLLYQEMGKNKEAIEMFRIIKQKYLASQQGREIDKYLARLGEVRD